MNPNEIITLRDQQDANHELLKAEYMEQRRVHHFQMKWFYHVFIEYKGEITMEYQEFCVKFKPYYVKYFSNILGHFDTLFELTIVYDKKGVVAHVAG